MKFRGLIALVILTSCMSGEEKKNAYLLEGNEALRTGFYRIALQKYKDALSIDSCYADAFNNIGVLYAERNSTGLALDYYSQALRCDQDFIPAYLNRAKLLYESNQLFSALNDLEIVNRLQPDSAYVLFSLGLVNTRLREFETAYSNFDQAAKLDQTNPEPFINKATTLYYLGRDDEAEALLTQALEAYPREGEPWNGLSTLNVKNGNLTLALEQVNKAIELNPAEAYYLNNRGYIRLLMNQPDSAVLDIDESLAMNSRNSWVYRNKGIYYFQKGETQDALRLLKQSYDMDPFTENVASYIAEVYLSTGSVAEACDWIKIAMENSEPMINSLTKPTCIE